MSKKTETIPFGVANFILEVSAKLAIRSGNDILRFEKITKTIESVEKERQELVQSIFDKHKATNEEVIEHLEDGKVNPKFDKEKYDLVNNDYQEAFNKGSKVDRKDLQLYTMDEFFSALPKTKDDTVDMPAFEITGLKQWVVKEVEEG